MSFRKSCFRLAATAFGLLVSAEAVVAADMPVKAAPIAPAYYDWSGVYVGVHAGYGGGMKDWNDQGFHFPAKGFLGGAQAGINKQIASLVFGLELDGSWANIKGSPTINVGGPVLGFQESLTATSKIDGLVTFAGRAGLAADRWFVFAKGGLALAHETHSFNFINASIPAAPGGSSTLTGSGSEYRLAPMIGFGAEYALGANWSVKAEYDYIHLGAGHPTISSTATIGGVTFPSEKFDTEIGQAIHVAKVGVNYRFGRVQVEPTFAPVPATPGYNWSGAYIGAQGGYGFGHKDWPNFVNLSPVAGKYDVNGWLAGGTVGANAQAGVFVFGVEGEWMWTGIKGSQSAALAGIGGATGSVGLESKVNWLAIAAARAGFVVGDKLMFYGKAGVALADETHSVAETLVFANAGSIAAVESGQRPAHRHCGRCGRRIRPRRQLVGQDRVRLHQDACAELQRHRPHDREWPGPGRNVCIQRCVRQNRSGHAHHQVRRELSLQSDAGCGQRALLIGCWSAVVSVAGPMIQSFARNRRSVANP